MAKKVKVLEICALGKTFKPNVYGLCQAISEAIYDQRNRVIIVFSDGTKSEVGFNYKYRKKEHRCEWDAKWDAAEELAIELGIPMGA